MLGHRKLRKEEHMTEKAFQPPVQRRSFLTRLSFGATAFAAAFVGASSTGEAETPANTKWQPTLHELDDWMDKIPGKHRMVFDSTLPDGFGIALPFANNFYRGNETYGLKDADAAVIIFPRHDSTPFGFNDAMWAKYGDPISKKNGFVDPKTKQAPKSNLFNVAGYGDGLANRGTLLDTLIKRGVQFGVCQLATRAYAGTIAMATGGNTDAIFNELIANLITNAHPVPAGIVAVNRAQDRGYAFVRA